ncbi:MAG: ABC transporter permease [Clostridium sp.]|uniref:ABC transporter permease n=1 Tax=Clostridium sp. TaxID=1506 RepID=UPI002FCC62F9
MRILSMTKKVIKQIIGDKRSLGLLFVAPVFVLFLLSIILNSSVKTPSLGLVADDDIPVSFVQTISKEATLTTYSREEGLSKLKSREIDGIISYISTNNEILIDVTVEGTETQITGAVKKALSQSISEYNESILTGAPVPDSMKIKPMKINTNFLFGDEDRDTFDSIAPMMMGFFIFFFVFLLAGIAFLRERISGTLDRLMATPIRRYEIVLGYFFGFGVFVLLQTVVIQLFMVYGLNIQVMGSPVLVLVINILLAAGSLALGTLLSTFAKTELQLFQFIPAIIVPQILFSGIFPLNDAPTWVIYLSKIFPLTYGADALTQVVIRGATFETVWFDILILFGYAVLFLVLNTLALKKYRTL